MKQARVIFSKTNPLCFDLPRPSFAGWGEITGRKGCLFRMSIGPVIPPVRNGVCVGRDNRGQRLFALYEWFPGYPARTMGWVNLNPFGLFSVILIRI